MEKNNKAIINAWCSYDIANSAYNLIITSVLFPLYYQTVTSSAFNGNMVSFLGFSIKNTVLYDYTLAFAYLLIIMVSPILSGIADIGGYRKRFMQFFTILGSTACFLLFWFTGYNMLFGLLMVVFAVIGYSGSLVYYNSFLPLIASPDKHDKISAKGFSLGYAGSMLLLISCLVAIENYKSLGFTGSNGQLNALRSSFLAVGIWWITLSQIAFYYLKDAPKQGKYHFKIISKGYSEIRGVFKEIRKNQIISPFLLSFFFFSMGVQTVVLVATLFGSAELGITGSKLIITILVLQLLGIAGSQLFAQVSVRRGNKLSLISMLVIWIAICITAFFITTEYEFYAIAAAVGLVMGGIQSQARSTFAKLIPENTTDTASYFSFYDISEKAAIVCGMFSFGFIEQITGNMRNSTLALAIFFIIALLIMLFVKLPAKYTQPVVSRFKNRISKDKSL